MREFVFFFLDLPRGEAMETLYIKVQITNLNYIYSGVEDESSLPKNEIREKNAIKAR